MNLFLFAGVITFGCDLFLSVYSKNTVLLIPSLLILAAIFLFFPFTVHERPGWLPLPVAAVSAALFYGILGQLTASVAIVDYCLVIAQSLCLLLIILFLCLPSAKEQEKTPS